MSKLNNIDIFRKFLKGEIDISEAKTLLNWLQNKKFEEWIETQWDESSDASESFDAHKKQKVFEGIKNKIQ